MGILNDAHASGYVTLKVKVSARISAQQFRDNHFFEDWVICAIQDGNYDDVSVIREQIELSDFDYNPEY